MKKSKVFLSVILGIFLIGIAPLAWAEELSGKDVMLKVDNRPKEKSSKKSTTMELINKKGNTRRRVVTGYTKDFGDVSKSIMLFKEPSDVRGIGFLSFSYEKIGKDDDKWLYLPALGKSRRISGASGNDDFMGTDFTYDDMGDRKVDEDIHNLLKEEEVEGQLCWVVESIPKEKRSLYSKKISWIRQDILGVVKVEFYDRRKKLLKVLILSDYEKKSDVWIAKRMEMSNAQTKHKTVITFEKIELNIPIKDYYFSVASLERGVIR